MRRSGAIARPVAPSRFVGLSKVAPTAFHALRCYSAASGLSKSEVEGRIVDLLKNFDKVNDLILLDVEHFSNQDIKQVADPSKVCSTPEFLLITFD